MKSALQGPSTSLRAARPGAERPVFVRNRPFTPVPSSDDIPVSQGFPRSGLPALATVETRDGPVIASDVQAGMSVRSLRGGWSPVRAAITVCHVMSPGDRSPVILRKEALGVAPALDLALPADQRVIVNTRRALPVAGRREVAVCCGDLVHLDAVVSLSPAQGVFVHLLLDSVDAVLVGNLWLETIDPRPDVLEALGATGRRMLFAAAPRLAHASGRARYFPVWPVLSSVEAQEVV